MVKVFVLFAARSFIRILSGYPFKTSADPGTVSTTGGGIKPRLTMSCPEEVIFAGVKKRFPGLPAVAAVALLSGKPQVLPSAPSSRRRKLKLPGVDASE